MDTSFSEIWDHLEFGAMAIGEARYDRYSVFGDVLYTKISASEATLFGVLADGGKLETEVFSGLIGGGYTVLEDTTGQLGVVGGALIWSVETTISLQGGIIDGQSRSDGDTWIDAVGGLKGSYSLTPNVYLSGWAPVGGGGADLDWDVAASLGFKFTRPFQLCSDIVPSTSISKTVVSNSTSSNRGASSPWSFNSSSKPHMGDWD